MALERVFALEHFVDQLYDDFYPFLKPAERRDGQRRGFRLLYSDAMGCLVSEQSGRELLEDRTYYRIDLDDFMEYATTTLAPDATIDQFPEGIAAFYELPGARERGA